MQSLSNTEKLSTPEVKQVKVDNWGTFFLQRLLQLYFNEELLDLTIQFHSNNSVLKVHRLVIAACTDYFVKLEREQNVHNCSVKNVIYMPMDMPYECVKSIVSFMYTGQLEYWSTEQVILYRTAQKMNMSILTQLLDAQMNTDIPRNSTPKRKLDKTVRSAVIEQSLNRNLSTNFESENRSTVWKRKFDTLQKFSSRIKKNYLIDNYGGPSRFDLPEIDDLTLGVFSSFDDITYNTQPIVQAPIKTINHNVKLNDSFDNTSFPDIIVSFDNREGSTKRQSSNYDSADDEWIDTDTISKVNKNQKSCLKKFEFDISENRYIKRMQNVTPTQQNFALENSIDNHAKIIREVLKKYPHLVQQNKNIRLKIMQKDSKNGENSTTGKTKVSYVILKSESLMQSKNLNDDSTKIITEFSLKNNETGPWKCCKCNLEENYIDYYMYRRHMQDVHNERFDPRICEHCGYTARKRNILMYHLYTKHNVSPPKHMSFPKCQKCSYIALSESLLSRHQVSHKHKPVLGVPKLPAGSFHYREHEQNLKNTCNVIHRENKLYDTCCHNIEKDNYCLHCGKYTLKINNLKLNIDYRHKVVENTNSRSGRQIYSSSENEALHHIVNGISTSLDIKDTSLVIETNEKEVKKLKLNNTVRSSSQYNEQDIIMLINDQGADVSQVYKDELALKSFLNNQMIVENSDGKMILCLQGNKNFHLLHKSGSNSSYETRQKLCPSDKIVMSELNIFEGKQHKIENQPTHNKKTCFKGIEKNFSNSEEVIQFIEEETEILEYETTINV